MNMKNKYLVILSLIFILLIPSLVSANRGMMVVGPREVSLQETGQNAIVAWNGIEEVLILSTDVNSSQSTLVLEVIPLPSNPTKVEEGSFDSFTKLTEIINKKVKAIREREINKQIYNRGDNTREVEITFHKKIGAHEVTVVKVNDLGYFINWVKGFTKKKGFEYTEISPEFKKTIASYLSRDIKFFVFDVIETGEDKQSIKPLIYRFKTDYLYYPLEITATSDAGWSTSNVNIFLIVKGMLDETIVRKINLQPRTGFDYIIELSKRELKEVNPEIAKLFSSAYVMNTYFHGSLNRLNKDLVVYKKDIHIPTIYYKIFQSISAFLAFQYISGIWEEIFTGYVSTWGKVLLAIILISFIIGIPSFTLIKAKLITKLLRKYNLTSFSYNLLAYLIPIIIVALLLFSSTIWLTIPVLVIFTIIGFSMIVYLVIKLFKSGSVGS